MESGEIWYQLVITDTDELSGESVHKLMALIINLSKIQTVITADLVGSIDGLYDAEGKRWTAEEFLLRVGKAVQYDWAFFYMFRESLTVNFDIADSMTILKHSDITVRLADDIYFYIYSSNEVLMSTLKSYYSDAIISATQLGKLEILY